MKTTNTRTETIANAVGTIYTIGQQFIMRKNFSNFQQEVVIIEISKEGNFFKVSGSDKLFSTRTLHAKGATLTSGYYLSIN